MIKQHNSLSVPQRTAEGTASNENNGNRNAPIANIDGATYSDTCAVDTTPDEDQQWVVETLVSYAAVLKVVTQRRPWERLGNRLSKRRVYIKVRKTIDNHIFRDICSL